MKQKPSANYNTHSSVPMKASPNFTNRLGQPLPPGAMVASRKKEKSSHGVIGIVKPKRETRIPSAGTTQKQMSAKNKPTNTSVPARINPNNVAPGARKNDAKYLSKQPWKRGPST